jgi:hypothetical protein
MFDASPCGLVYGPAVAADLAGEVPGWIWPVEHAGVAGTCLGRPAMNVAWRE